MHSEQSPTIDPITEFRLRTWARRNHVPIADRDATWHPIVHDEMDRRDGDRPDRAAEGRQSIAMQDLSTDWLRNELEASTERLNAQRRELERLTMTNEAIDAEPTVADSAAAAPDWWASETTISAYVPLPPGPFRLLDEPHAGVPAPHLGSVRSRIAPVSTIGIPESW